MADITAPNLFNHPKLIPGSFLEDSGDFKHFEKDDFRFTAATKPTSLTSVDHLWGSIHETSQWGSLAQNNGGMSRLSLSDQDKDVRNWFIQEAGKLNCQIRVDAVGNIFAILQGENTDIPPIGVGSHLDTQPAGGRFDGILGVLAGLEILRTIVKSGRKPYTSIAVINWCNEEGARYTSGCTGSAVWSGHVPLREAYQMPTSDGSSTLGQELQRIGYLGRWEASHKILPLSAHFELHIEQGHRLEDARKKIGVVDAIQGIRWYTVTVRGEQAHAGATPVMNRADAVVAMSKVVVKLEQLALETGVFATVGEITVESGSSNVISGLTHFTVDLRHPRESLLDEVEHCMCAEMSEISQTKNGRVSFAVKRVWHSPAVFLDPLAVQCVQDAAHEVVGVDQLMPEMISFAGHDIAPVASNGTPTAMIFVPSLKGISHAPEEWTSKEDCGLGTEVLYHAVRKFDQHLQRKEESLANI